MTREHIQFVTGKLAEHAMRRVVDELASTIGFDYSLDVLPITVAALMTPAWVARHLRHEPRATKVLIPGYCEGDLQVIEQAARVPVVRGPRDLRQLPQFFGQQSPPPDQLQHNIEILAEINHAPRLAIRDILAQANRLRADGADLIDVGCDPGMTWAGVADCVRAIRDQGMRVSIDSLNPHEIEPAVRAGAELVLSVNATNREAAGDWGCEVVVIPDDFATLGGLDETLALLAGAGVKLRIDPVLEPIGCGFALSLGRYLEVRRRYPDAEMMMGIGNLTELSDADSAPINLLLLGFCEELRIASVLTTQVINWARTSVRECDLARRMVCFAVQNQVPPKHVNVDYVLLRDAKLLEYGADELDRLASQIKDNNYRLFAEGGQLHLISASMHLKGVDPFLLFAQLLAQNPRHLDASHAFYLGFELCKAATALQLGKRYEQDEPLDWGFLTEIERHHRLSRKRDRTSNDQIPMNNDQGNAEDENTPNH
jgi:dihydropteroate synthase-like protein